MELSKQVAVVTGGTGGLGQAVVAELLEAGASVFVPHRKAGDLEKLRKELGLNDDAALYGAKLDLADEDAVKKAYAKAAKELGGIDLLVNVAGGFDGGKPVHESSWEIWQQQLDINLKTSVISCAAAVPFMIERSGGAIVNVSSRTATQAGANLGAYAAAKRAVLQLTETLAAELLQHDIRVNAVLPSTIDTPTNRKAMPKADHTKWVEPAEIAAVIRFLLGPSAKVISGASIPVYGKA